MSGVAVKPNPVFTGAEFVMRARARLSPLPFEAPPSQGVAGLRGDHIMNPMSTPSPRRLAQLRSAAVLVPVMVREGEATLLLTQRTEELPAHAGQVAFPGGRIDPEDASPEAAAMREAHEEVALDPALVTPVGRLPDYLTGSGYRIVPVLATIAPGRALTPNPDEVDAVFDVPLSFLMDPANHRMESRIWQGRERFYYTMPFGERFIWGVTAGIIRSMFERLYR